MGTLTRMCERDCWLPEILCPHMLQFHIRSASALMPTEGNAVGKHEGERTPLFLLFWRKEHAGGAGRG